jgi:hypothetical protein
LRDLRQFSGWKETPAENEPELTDETICYLWDDFTVVRSPVQDKESIFAEVTPEWQAFCQQNLQFAIPADLQRPEQPGVVEAAKEASNV